jgi:hypothetical protein
MQAPHLHETSWPVCCLSLRSGLTRQSLASDHLLNGRRRVRVSSFCIHDGSFRDEALDSDEGGSAVPLPADMDLRAMGDIVSCGTRSSRRSLACSYDALDWRVIDPYESNCCGQAGRLTRLGFPFRLSVNEDGLKGCRL